MLDIADRRNELAGNLSLYQELHGIEVIDRLLAEGVLVGSRYKHITVRVLEFARPPSSRLLGPTSKLNRDAAVPARAHGRRANGRPRSSSPRWPSRAPGAPRTSKRCSATSRRTCS